MKVICPNCGIIGKIDPVKISKKSAKVKCPKCRGSIPLQKSSDTSASKIDKKPTTKAISIPDSKNNKETVVSKTTQCPFCGKEVKTGAQKCDHCEELLLKHSKTLNKNGEEVKPPRKKPSVLLVIFAWLAGVGALFAYIIPPSLQPMGGAYLSVWIGIATALTARRKGKSGWLWFFIGFICVGFTTIFLIGFYKGYSKAYNEPIEASQGLTASELIQKSWALLKDEEFTDPHQALEYLNQAIHLDPNNASAYTMRGIVWDGLDQHQRAIDDFDQSIHLDPNKANAYLSRGIAWNNLDQHKRAIEDCDQAIRLDPTDDLVYKIRGVAYYKFDKPQRAIEDYDQSIRRNPNNADTYVLRGYAYGSLGQHQRAIEDYDQSIHLDPNKADAYLNRGIAWYNLDQHQRAIEDYDQAIRLDPTDAKTYYNRGVAYVDSGQFQLAIEDYDQAIRLDPTDVMIYFNRKIAYYFKGEYDKAWDDIHKIQSLGYRVHQGFIKDLREASGRQK